MQPLLQWENNKYYIFWVWVCSLRYPTCNAHAPYCQLWPVWLYYIFPHYLTAARFKKKSYWTLNVCFIFSTTCNWNIAHSKNWAIYDQKCTVVFMQSTRYSCQLLMQLKFSRQSFEKYPNSRFNENSSSGNRVVPCRQTDKTKLIVAFCVFANTPNNDLKQDDVSIHNMRNILMVKET